MAVNLDTASEQELKTLANIGQSRAKLIIAMRNEPEGITMYKLVTRVQLGQDYWAGLWADGKIVTSMPEEVLKLPSVDVTEDTVAGGITEQEVSLLRDDISQMRLRCEDQVQELETLKQKNAMLVRESMNQQRAYDINGVEMERLRQENIQLLQEQSINYQKGYNSCQQSRDDPSSYGMDLKPPGHASRGATSDGRPGKMEGGSATASSTAQDFESMFRRLRHIEERMAANEGKDAEKRNEETLAGLKAWQQENNSEESDDSSTSPSEDEGSDESAGVGYYGKERSQRHGHSRRRGRSPPAQKLATFHGEVGKWRAFLFSFKAAARTYKWSSSSKLERLVSCMQDKAVEFVFSRPREVQTNYRLLLRELKKRYGAREPADVLMRKWAAAKQEEGELLDDYGERVYRLTSEAYPGVDEKKVQSWAVLAFLKGAKEKWPAMLTRSANPRSLTKAIRLMKRNCQDYTSFGRPSPVRAVTFQGRERSLSPAVNRGGLGQQRSPPPERKAVASGLDVSELSRVLSEAVAKAMAPQGGNRAVTPPASPSRGKCYNCGGVGHFKAECPSKSTKAAGTPGSPGKGCYQCGEMGHMMRNCPKKEQGSN